jgi:hypothetical protein
MWQVVSGIASLLSDCGLQAVVQTVAGDGKPYLLHTRGGDAQVRPAALVAHGLLTRRTPPWSPCAYSLTEAVIRLVAVMAAGRPGDVVGAGRLLSAEPVISVKGRAGTLPVRGQGFSHLEQ